MITDIKYKDYTHITYKFMKVWDSPNKESDIKEGAWVTVCYKEKDGKILDSVTFVNGEFYQQNKI